MDDTIPIASFYDLSEPPILQFQGEHRFLSNFFPSPFQYCDLYWPHVEAAYQAMKSADPDVWETFTHMSASDAKRAGRAVKCRPDWEHVKVNIMGEVVLRKFVQNPNLRSKLMQTGKRLLVEGNHHHDRFWGVCPPGSTLGQNTLGDILMVVRYRLSVA